MRRLVRTFPTANQIRPEYVTSGELAAGVSVPVTNGANTVGGGELLVNDGEI